MRVILNKLLSILSFCTLMCLYCFCLLILQFTYIDMMASSLKLLSVLMYSPTTVMRVF